MADYWDKYMQSTETEDVIAKLKLLTECLGQTEDEVARRVAAHDLGDIFYMGKGVPVDKERGKNLMKLSADLGHPQAMNLYGQMLTHDGDTECITYFCMALDEAQVLAARNLNQLLVAFQKSGNTQLCNAIEAGVGEVARINREKVEEKDGTACLVLALIGLYGLGQKCGISVSQGEEYMQKSIEKGHPMAKIINESPELKHPEALPYNNTAKNTEKVEGTAERKDSNDTDSEPTPFGIGDVIFSLIAGAIGGLLINWIFDTGFLIPFIVVTLIGCVIMFMGSKH